MIIDELIFDRTAADVERVNELKRKIASYAGIGSLTPEELAEYMGGMKGAYNYTDLNRVGEAVELIAPLVALLADTIEAYCQTKGVMDLELVGYESADVVVNPKTDWEITDTPTVAQMNQYIHDIRLLWTCMAKFLPADNPEPPLRMGGLTYDRANAIERTLYNIYTYLPEIEAMLKDKIDHMALTQMYSGEIYSGEM